MVTQPVRRLVKRIHRISPRTAGGPAKARHAVFKVTDAMKARLELLDSICSNTRSVTEQMPVISTINEMTRYTLNASASSVLLCDENNVALTYKFTDCPLGTQFEQLQTARELGIAGLVLHKGQPLILNAIDKDERFNQYKDEVAGLVARSVICAPMIVKDAIIGAIEVINKLDGNDFNENDLSTLTGLANNAASTIENVRLHENLLFSYKSMVQRLVSSADTRETTESKHSRRVAEYALTGATHLMLSEEEQETIEYGAILHDIGLLSIPPEILKKREALTREDWIMIRKHPVIGYSLLRGIPSLNEVSKLILYHHERYDGKGYPCGLKGETIPVGARLISVADAFDSMTVKHSYRAASTAEVAMKELGKCSGSQFCPVAVKAFCLGYIKSRSLVRVRTRKEPPVIINKKHTNDSTIWPISFGQSSLMGKNTPPS